MNDSYSWTRMLDEFRSLGGVAQNVEQRIGQYGNGIFPIDPSEPIAIEIPEPLLVDVDQIVLDGEDLVVKPESAIANAARDFFARYQKHFSWGAEGRKNVDSFESALKTLPEPLLAKMRQLTLLNLEARHQGQWIEVLRRRFLDSRKINYHERAVSMPIIELINHCAHSPGYSIGQGIKVAGTFDAEVTVNYSATCDSLRRFLNYGFANLEPYAYSLPLHVNIKDIGVIVVSSDVTSIRQVDGLGVPKVELENQRRVISHLRLALEKAPRMPRTMLRKALSDLPETVVDELFERFRNANLSELCNLLELCEGVNTPIGSELRRALLLQLRALTHCFGVRTDLVGAAPQS